MARKKREISPTGIYHVLLRGIDELFSTDEDFKEFVTVLEKYFEKRPKGLLGYLLMKNRVHLIIDEGDAGISGIMKPICTSYARYYNRVHDLQGKLFYDRYRSEPVKGNNELEAIKSFLKSIPSEYKGGVENAGDIDTLSCIDDYSRMTDEELKDYIEEIFKIKISKMPKDQRKVMAEKIIAGKRVSSGRIYKIFSLGRRVNENTIPKKEEVKIEEKPQRKNDLSIWLL